MEILINLVINSLFIFGIHSATRKGELLEFLSFSVYGNRISKPFTECPKCMASIWGVVGYLNLFQVHQAKECFIFCVCLCGLNYLLERIICIQKSIQSLEIETKKTALSISQIEKAVSQLEFEN